MPWQDQYPPPRQCLAGQGDGLALRRLDLILIAHALKEAGKTVPVRVDGTLENLGAYYKVFHGTWTQGTRKGEFTVSRN